MAPLTTTPPDPPGRKRLSPLSLRGRLLLLVLLIFLPVLGIIAYTGIEQRRQAAVEAQHTALRSAHFAAANYARLIAEGRQLLAVLGQLPEVSGAAPVACHRTLARLLEGNSRFANFGVIGADGLVRCSAVPVVEGANVTDRAYFRRAFATRAFAVGVFHMGRITRLPVLVLAHPVTDATGHVQAVVFAALKRSWFNDLAAQAELPPGSTVTILDSNRTVLVRYPDPEPWIGKRAGESTLIRAANTAREEDATEAEDLDGVRRLFAFVPLKEAPPDTNLFLSVGIPARLAYAQATAVTFRNQALPMLLTALALATAWFGADRFVLRRFDALMSAPRLGAGDLNARSLLQGNHDDNRPAVTFDAMAETLERQVARVAALSRVYAMLSHINAAILRIRDRDGLLAEACRVAVEQGGFRLAWIGLIDPQTRTIRPLAHAGEAGEYLVDIRLSLDADQPEGRGPTGRALREDSAKVCNDIESDPCMVPWRERAREFGLRSLVALPLRIEDRVIGTFNLYASQPGFFSAEEVRLLEELAADTSLGLDQIEKAQQLGYLANYDPLTRLPNRALFEDRLKQVLARARHSGRHVAVLALYLDSARQVSGVLGRQAGDELLRQVSARLAEAVREGDTVARLGGATFGAVLADVARIGDVSPVVRRMLDHLPDALDVRGEKIVLALRAGVAVYPTDGDQEEVLIKYAELALHAPHNEAAGPIAFYSGELGAQASERHRLEQELHGALERGELFLQYQPVVDIATRRVTGVEALLRWENPKLGRVPPAKFIPVAEQTGLILPIGEWVLESACRQAMRWAAAGFSGLRVAINVSVRQLHAVEFPERVEAALRRAGFDARRAHLAIEVTESELMRDVDQAAAALARLKKLGLRVYVDDFGTGYSALAYLKRLPVDTLKIDQSFVRDLGKDPEARAVAKAIIALAESLDLEVIAEGVETEQQFQILRELRCGLVQGYLFSPPQSPAEVERFFGAAHHGELQITPPPVSGTARSR